MEKIMEFNVILKVTYSLICILIDQDYILLIFNCHKCRNKAEIQKKGWLQTLPKTIQCCYCFVQP